MNKYKCPDCDRILKEKGDLEYVMKEIINKTTFLKFDFKKGEETDQIDRVNTDEFTSKPYYYYMCGFCGSEYQELEYFEV